MVQLAGVVLAAGQGKRMLSSRPKVLHEVAGRPMVAWPVLAALQAGAERVVVVVAAEQLEAISSMLEPLAPGKLSFAIQQQPRGTGDAARVALEGLEATTVLILCGDTPLLTGADLLPLVETLKARPANKVVVGSCRLADPSGYGRILRAADGGLVEIREHRDLRSDQERAIGEVNAGVYAADVDWLRGQLAQLRPDNAQGEYYLTDAVMAAAGQDAAAVVVGAAEVSLGVNDRAQLSEVEALMYSRIAQQHARRGVTIHGRPSIGADVELEADAEVFDAVQLRGRTKICAGARIDVGCVVTDSTIEAMAQLKPYSVVTASFVGAHAQIGPFAHLRPESVIEEEAHIGNFVETKKTRVRRGAKANHLAYLGDGDVGEKANVGAGTIFCNYDGFMKHRTVIGPGAFIGSDSQIVAPVTIGAGAYVGTGTTVTQDVPEDALAISRVRQENKLGYASRLRGRLAAAKKAKG
jgi:bifunctional UDP-N-acetylglucosamine pyrophosphorylase/glucosamine-1-phosphate N-acetyltransferase